MNRTGYILGGGQSLKTYDVSQIPEDCTVIALNGHASRASLKYNLSVSTDGPFDSFLDPPFWQTGATFWFPEYFLKMGWVPEHHNLTLRPFKARLWNKGDFDYEEFLFDPELVYFGENPTMETRTSSIRGSLQAAFKVAWMLGLRRINLCAFDDSDTYGEPIPLCREYWPLCDKFLIDIKPTFDEAGLEIFNCTAVPSWLTAFPHMSFEASIKASLEEARTADYAKHA